jgi:hypothetical protein
MELWSEDVFKQKNVYLPYHLFVYGYVDKVKEYLYSRARDHY